MSRAEKWFAGSLLVVFIVVVGAFVWDQSRPIRGSLSPGIG